MKLRNKKTGEIRDGRVEVVFQNNDKFPNPLERHTVESIDELNEEWEDYTPAEPLIKDEKIRKAIRAWADVNGCDKLLVRLWEYCGHGAISFYDEDGDNEITFATAETFGLEHLKYYTITELCGKEQE